MHACRIHITGASGAGTTTLGRALATRWAVPHADADDYYWLATSPPYVAAREAPERLRLMGQVFLPRDAWVLSGSIMSWGDPLIPYFDAVLCLRLDGDVRLARLRSRERLRYGTAVEPGGARHDAYRAFIRWAAAYDDPRFDGRSRARHEQWLARLHCPVLHLDAEAPVEQLLDAVDGWEPAAGRRRT